MPRIITAIIICLSLVTAVKAAPIEATVNTAQSSVTVQLCMLGKCSSDSSPVAGSASVKVNPIIGPASLAICDFDFSLTQSIDLYLSWGFLGNITATGQNISMHFPPGQPCLPPTTVSGGSFTYSNVPSDNQGIVSYTATGTPCALLQASGKPCTDTINLADQGTSTGNMNGTVTVSPSRALRLTLYPNYTGPIDPNNPSLGTMTITGTVVCTATIPLRADADLNNVINGLDSQKFIDVMLVPAAFTWRDRFAVDMNDDDIYDLADVQLFVACLLSGGCN
jgi:hypothetical protein